MTAEVDVQAVARELFPNQPEGFPHDDFDLLGIRLPADDDMGIKSDDEDVDEDDVQTETGFGSVIVVGNLPVVPPEKYDKLCTVIKKIYSQIGNIREGGMHMPLDEAGKQTKGFAFIEFSSPQEAQAARDQTNGYKLDKNHTFAVNMFDDLDKYSKVPDEYVPPTLTEYQSTENLHSWMMDKRGRDQFVVRHGDDTVVFWNDAKAFKAEEAYKRQFWTESFVQWSPQGNFLATVHRQGVAVWGGPSFTRLARYSHPAVRLIEFSPNERYLLSYSSVEPSNPRETVTVVLNIFDVRTGRRLRGFDGAMDEFAVGANAGPGGALKWPVFKWAGGSEDLYFARLGKNMLSIYECPDMVLHNKKSLKLDGVHDFEWSPSEAILAAYTTEQGNLPARIALVKVPERTELRQKNLFSVSDIKIFWHPQGDYLAVKVDRFTKTKKSTYTGFELFSIRERDIPMEVLELPNKSEKIIAFAWEPRGHRFAVVHGEGARPNVSFYSMKDDKGRPGVKLIGTLTNKACNQIAWSPQGRNIVLAGLKNLNGQLEFYNVDEMETLNTAEHFMCTDVDWDPTGRYIATSVTSIQQMENGFKLWSFNGKLLYEMHKDRFFQFGWRPRMPSLLPPEKEAEIARNLKQYSKRYEEEDEALLQEADAEVLQDRARARGEWQEWYATKKEYLEALEAFKRDTYGALYEEGEYEMQRVSVEQTLEVREEPYNI